MPDKTPLAQYLQEVCDDQNLSLRQASLMCNLSPEAVSQLVRRGRISQPRPATLMQIAEGLGLSFEYLMRLAGHLPPLPESDPLTPEARAMANQIQAIWREINEADPDALAHLLNVVHGQAEMVKAVVDSQRTKHERGEKSQEENRIKS